jgi:sugar phosphate isomerase/epimerase
VAIVDACARPNLGVCVDVWHHTRSSGAVALAPVVPASMIHCVQLNDGPLVPVDPDYKDDCLRNRLAPGAGEMDVAGFATQVREMGVDLPWTVEVCRGDDELTERRGRTHALRCVAAARAVLREARLAHDSSRTT